MSKELQKVIIKAMADEMNKSRVFTSWRQETLKARFKRMEQEKRGQR